MLSGTLRQYSLSFLFQKYGPVLKKKKKKKILVVKVWALDHKEVLR